MKAKIILQTAIAAVLIAGIEASADVTSGSPVKIADTEWRVMSVVDVDSNGDLDLVFKDPRGTQVIIGQFENGFKALQLGLPCFCKIVVKDFDGNKKPDFHITFDDGREDFLLQNEDGSFQVANYR